MERCLTDEIKLECNERTDQLYLEPATQKVFLCYCLRVGLPRQYHSDVWSFWKTVVEKWPGLIQRNLLNWFCVIIYKYLTTKTKLLTNEEYKPSVGNLTVYHLCHYACMTLSEFLTLLKCLETQLHGENSSRTIALQHKICVDVAIAKKHFELCKCIFNQNHPSVVNTKELPWLLFLVAKLLKIGNAMSIVEYYNLYLCSLCNAISLTDLDALYEPFGSIVSISSDAHSSVLEYVCIKLDLPLKKFMTFYQTHWIPFHNFLQQVCQFSKDDLVNYLKSKYEDSFSKVCDLHELLFLDETNSVIYVDATNDLIPNQQFNTNLLQCNIQSIFNISLNESPLLTSELKKHLENGVKYNEKKFSCRQTYLQSWFMKFAVQQVDFKFTGLAASLCSTATRLYLMKLESILNCESKRTLKKDLSNLLLNGMFHKSLFAVCSYVVLISEGCLVDQEKMLMTSTTKSLNIDMLNIHTIFETFILHEPFLSRDLNKKLLEFEEQLLTHYIWKEEAVYECLSRASLRANEVIKMTPEYYCDTYYDGLVVNPNSRYLIRRVRRVMQNRLLMICDALDFDDKQFLTTWPCLEYSILFMRNLTYQRHLDQILLCSVYSMAKVLEKEVQFRAIIEGYKNMKLGTEEVYKNVLIKDGIFDSVISFYNTVYMESMKDFLLRHGLCLQNSLKLTNIFSSASMKSFRLVKAKYPKTAAST